MICSKEITTKLTVKDICGTHTLTRADGKLLHKVILARWKTSKSIEIDFANVTIASVSFLDEAVGQLIIQFPRKDIASKLKLVRISQFDRKLLNDIAATRFRQILKKRKIQKSL